MHILNKLQPRVSLIIVLLLVVFVVLATACTAQQLPAEAPASAPQAEQVPTGAPERSPVTILVGWEADTFDPAHAAGSMGIQRNVFDTLLTKDEAGQLQPGVATEWSQIDESTWEFKIREGLTAHNGEVIDAHDVAYSLNRVLDPEVQGRGHYLWLAGNMQLDHAEAVDDQTVHLVTKGVSGNIPEFLWTWYILPEDHYSSTPLEELARVPVGSGPYRFVESEARRGQSYRLEAFEDYWRGPAEIDTLIFRVIPETSAAIAEMNTGGGDMMFLAPPLDLQEQLDPEYASVVNIQGLRRVIMGIVFYNDPAVTDKRVRQAFNHAVDVQRIIDSLLGGLTERTASFVNPPNVPDDLKPYEYDPERARELLAEAGYEDVDGDGFVDRPDGSRLELTLMTTNGRWPGDLEVSQAVAADLKAAGVFVEVEPMESATYTTMLATAEVTGEFWSQAAAGGYGCQADISDFTTHTQWQPGGWVNQEFDDLFLEMTHTTDPERYQELCYELQYILYDEAPLIFMYNQVDPYALSHRIEWTPYSHGRNNFYTMKWAEQ
jgi:peptide/nickel transport system substrate-binding protein